MRKMYKQLGYLVLKELRAASRTRYIVISFMILPLLMWGIQGGIQIVTQTAISGQTEGGTLYITNADTIEPNVTLTKPFTLPFDFDGMKAGSNTTKLNLAKYLIEDIRFVSKNDNTSPLFGFSVIDNLSFNKVQSMAQEGKVDYWLHIHNGFAMNYTLFNSSFSSLELRYLPGGFLGPNVIQSGLQNLLSQPPFTIVTVEKVVSLKTVPINIGGEEENPSQLFGAGFAGFLAILIAVMAPAPFVSTSFAGEREKRTLEALLALPLSRKSILGGKLIAGMVLVGVFALMNLIGMVLYNYIITEYSNLPQNINQLSSFGLVLDLSPMTLVAITIAMFLSAFIAIGIGISIASLTKDVRTSESLYSTILMIPSLIVGMAGMFGGVPESFGREGVVLYIIPWSHALAIFQKILRPNYYEVKSLLGYGVVGDLIFHLAALFVTIVIILIIAARIFEREGIVN